MKARKISTAPLPTDNSNVTLTVMGDIFEIRYQAKANEPKIRKYDKDHYIDLRTGEFCEFNHSTTRAEDMGSLAQSLKRLREIINTNVTEPKNALWVTLTYAENMTDEKRLYEDFRRFHQRLKTYHHKQNLPGYHYIAVGEPQGRRSWHLHLLLIYTTKAPFIPNADIARIWKHGFTKTMGLKNVDNLGAYLSAYLGDMELTQAFQNGMKISSNAAIKEFTVTDESGSRNTKHYIKGARLKFYPKGFKIYRTSKGIIPPTVVNMPYNQALQVVGNAPLTYEHTIQLVNDCGEVINTINYKQYNRKRKSPLTFVQK